MNTSLPSFNNKHQGALERSTEPSAQWPAFEGRACPGQLPDLNLLQWCVRMKPGVEMKVCGLGKHFCR